MEWIKYEFTAAISTFLVLLLLYAFTKILRQRKSVHHKRKYCRTMICLGSGGHTTEMLSLAKNLDFSKYKPRCYVIANTDAVSLEKLHRTENAKDLENSTVIIAKIPRSRHVNQSYFTSVLTTLNSILYCIPLVYKFKPELILCNGPGTCIPICLIAFVLRVMFICDTKIIFIESFCRTQTLSLSGRILLYIADHFVVHWPGLKAKVQRAEYLGQLL